MNEKIYEMDDDYKQAVADLLEFIALRDELAEALPLVTPERRNEARQALAEMDQKIEECEAALAKEYEAHQAQYRAEEVLEETLTEAMANVEKIFIYIKHRHPENLDELKNAVLKDFTPEEEQEFYDRIAIREAAQLAQIIAGKKKA